MVITDSVPVGQVDNLSYTSSGVILTRTVGTTYTWRVQDLAPGQGGFITISGQLEPTLPQHHVVTNTAVITAVADAVPGNNTSSAAATIRFVTAVAPPADSRRAALETTLCIRRIR